MTSVVDPDPDALGLLDQNPDPSINKQNKQEKPRCLLRYFVTSF
jgi:hypothetical protein